jgi:integrase
MNRTLSLTVTAAAVLLALTGCSSSAKTSTDERIARGEESRPWVETGKVFTPEDGSWLHPDAVAQAFRRISKEAGLPPINLRDVRHIAATLVHAGGGDLHAIKGTLRH